MNDPLHIASDFVVMTDRLEAQTVPVDDELFAKLDEIYGSFAGHTLISCHRFESDWPTWEVHPAGDEIVLLMSGAAEMVFAESRGDRSITLTEPGQFVVVPRGMWHTAKIARPTQMLFVTPGEATENRETPIRNRDGR